MGLLDQILAHLPHGFHPLRPWLAGFAAMLEEADAQGAALVEAGTFGGSEGKWLRLHARGYGLKPGPDESDEALRERMRSPERKITRPALQEAIDAALAPHTEEKAELVEWWDYPVIDDDWILDTATAHLVALPNSFVVIMPVITDETDPSIADVAAAVFGARAAGIRWTIILEET